MPRTDSSYFNFILKNNSARFNDKITVLDADEYDNFQYESYSSDDISYDSSTGVVTFSKGGTYEIFYSELLSNLGGSTDDYNTSPKFYINDTLKYVSVVHRANNYDPDQQTHRAILEIPDNGTLKIMVDLSGTANCYLHPSTAVIAHRLTGYYARVHLSGSTRVFKNINPFTGSHIRETIGSQAIRTIQPDGRLLNNGGYDDTHGRLISSGSSTGTDGPTGIYSVAFNGTFGTGTVGGVSITASQNGVDFYSRHGLNANSFDPGPVHYLHLLKKMRRDDYISLYVQNFNTSDVLGAATNAMTEGTSFAISEVRSHAYHCCSITGYAPNYQGRSLSISANTKKNPWKLSDTAVWDDTSNADHSASMTVHATSPYIDYDQGSGKFTVKRAGTYFVSAITNVKNGSIFSQTFTKELRVNGSTFVSSSETHMFLNEPEYAQPMDIVTLLTLSAGDEIEYFGTANDFTWRFAQGTSMTIYKIGDDWKYKDDDFTEDQYYIPEDVISDDFTLKTYSTGGASVQSKRDVPQLPFIAAHPGPLSLRGKVEVDRMTSTLNEADAERYLFTKK